MPGADGIVTYGQIFAIQPFGNNLVVKTLTGAQLKALLEQQFDSGTAASRPTADAVANFPLRLRHVAARRAADRGDGLNGKPIDPAAQLSGDGQQLPG